jgi:hypothetical protein
MSGPPRAQIEADRECLLQPLHDRRELQAIHRPDIKRRPLFLEPKSPKLEGEALPRLTKYLAEARYRLSSPEHLDFLKKRLTKMKLKGTI